MHEQATLQTDRLLFEPAKHIPSQFERGCSRSHMCRTVKQKIADARANAIAITTCVGSGILSRVSEQGQVGALYFQVHVGSAVLWRSCHALR